MKLYSINTGHFKLDGGAMFGVVPKSLWNKKNPADENNLCSWAMRCLLIEEGNRLILIDNGIGSKQDAKFFGYYYMHGEDSLEKSLAKYGFLPEDITHNLLTHLHFDHCGGGIKWNLTRTAYEATFPKAQYYCSKGQWDLMLHPNPREKASFLPENIEPMEQLGVLTLLDNESDFGTGITLRYVHGHTEGMIIPLIHINGKTIAYMADLLPSAAHIPLPWVMAYDTRPLISMEEKEHFLNEAAANNYILFFEHDPLIECCTVEDTGHGIRVKETMMLADAF